MCRFDEWETKEESVKGENDDDEVKDVASGLSCVCVCCLPVANDVDDEELYSVDEGYNVAASAVVVFCNNFILSNAVVDISVVVDVDVVVVAASSVLCVKFLLHP